MAKVSINIATGSIQQEELIVGIDLGTTNSLIAIVREDDGQRRPLALRETDGLTLVPSIVHFGANGEVHVGNEARAHLIAEPERTIYSVKRLMGKSYKDVREDAGRFAYKVIDDDTDSLVKIAIGDRYFSPMELSAHILHQLKARAEHLLKVGVNKAVITVPAYFNDTQRQATRDAGRLAGLDVLRIINEPTAAALAYGLGVKSEEERIIAVYDLGGGTFDISILRISGGIFEVLSTHGDTYLGGDDFDRVLGEQFIMQNPKIKSEDASLRQELRLLAEEAKKTLSTGETFEGTIQDKKVKATREEFNRLIQPLVDRTLDSCRQAMKDAGLTAKDIDAVVMVGGSTRVPLVKDSVKELFGRDLYDSLNPDEVVALGAAVQADILAGKNTDMLLLDVTPLSLGIETMGGLMDVLIPRNSKIPAKAGRQYTTQKDGQSAMAISVYQGERDLVSDNRKLASFNLSGIPAMPAGLPKVEITFLIDADGILRVSAKELRSGVSQDIQVQPQYGLTDEQVEKMLLDSLTHAREDMETRAVVEAATEAEQMLDTTAKFIDKNRGLLSDEEVVITQNQMTALREYKEVSIELAKASLEHFNDQYRSLNEQERNEVDRRTELEAIVATGEAAIEKDKASLISHEQELNGLQKSFNELLNRVRQLEGDKRLAAQRLEHLRERERSLNETISGAGQQLGKLEESIAFAGQQIASETTALEDLRVTLEALRKDVDESRSSYDAAKQSLDATRGRVQTAQRRQFDAEKKVAVADTSVMNLQRSIQHLQEEAAGRATQIENIQKERASAEGTLEAKQETLQAMLTRQEEVKGRILQGQEELEGLRANLVEENRKLDARRNEHDLLKSLVDSLEGYPDSIKFLKRNKEWGSNAPLLSDVFVVKAEYRTALESVLDQYLNYYVVENVQEAAQAVRLLEGAKKGKANFILLDRIGSPAAHATTSSNGDGVTHALDAVEVEDKYRSLAEHLLGHVFIHDNLPEGAQSGNGEILVDKTGRYKADKYTVGGGSIGLFEGNKIGRAKNLERLAADIATLTETTNAFRKQISETQSRLAGFNAELADKAIEANRQEINRLQNSIANFGNRIETYEAANATSSRRMQELQAQLNQTQESISGTREELTAVEKEMQEIAAAVKEAETAFAAVESRFNAATQQYNTQNLQYTRQQSKMESLKGELQFRSNQLTETQRQLAQSKESLETNHTHIAETEKTLHSGDEELYNLLSRKEADEKALNEKDRAYYELRNAVSAAESALSQKRKEKESADALLSGIKDKLGEMKLQLAGMKERLHVEFKVSLDEILDQPRNTEQSVEELTAESDRMKKRLENIGEVNPTAIEAFTEVKARHDFIVEQKTDLVNAKDSLLATIEEVEATANARFKETFEAVRENFVTVFKALFTPEDSADLRLTDPDNVAESGIEIYAQPKGKKPSTLTQLSGGEKTLTSTAFLFAIYLIKPAPFCILDEVDAPLDDANVGKFTNMIRQFSDNSQFIIVTHNKQTMAAVDVIYGVTMQEPGVSKLVPVDFRSLN